jgi:hypothetical protein
VGHASTISDTRRCAGGRGGVRFDRDRDDCRPGGGGKEADGSRAFESLSAVSSRVEPRRATEFRGWLTGARLKETEEAAKKSKQ